MGPAATVDAVRLRSRQGAGGSLRQSVPALVACVPVLGLASAQGGYFASAWGWASLPLFWVLAIALTVRSQLRLTGAECTFIATLTAFTGWIALSTIWSAAPAETMLEFERALVYVAGAAAVLVVSKSSSVSRVLGGVLAAISSIAAFSLATRLVPDRVGVFDRTAVYRLAQPIGYWNGLALFTAMGMILALGFAARARALPVRAVCAAALIILLPTFYFTFGRAGWIALAVGLIVALAIDPRRLQLLMTLLVLAPTSVTAIWLAAHSPGLTHSGVNAARAAHDGHHLALALGILAVLSASAATLLGLVERQVVVSVAVRRVFAAACAAALAAALLLTFVEYGGPQTLVRKGYAAFKAPPPHAANLNRRLLSFSGNGRYELWRLAWNDARHHPWLGSGAGTYERYFLRHQPADVGRVRDAHGLYLETLAELGPFGLALLLVGLGTPLVVAVRARAHPLVPAALGAYAAFLVHAMVDWDWELPAVTLAALMCGAAVLLAERHRADVQRVPTRARVLAAGVVIVVSAIATVGLIGNTALKASDSALRAGDWDRAAASARRARTLMPWSPQPWSALGEAQLAAGLVQQARASFRKAASMDTGDWHLWYDLARASSGRTRLEALRHAVALFPRSGLLLRKRALNSNRVGAMTLSTARRPEPRVG
jgi:hypothetical protein